MTRKRKRNSDMVKELCQANKQPFLEGRRFSTGKMSIFFGREKHILPENFRQQFFSKNEYLFNHNNASPTTQQQRNTNNNNAAATTTGTVTVIVTDIVTVVYLLNQFTLYTPPFTPLPFTFCTF